MSKWDGIKIEEQCECGVAGCTKTIVVCRQAIKNGKIDWTVCDNCLGHPSGDCPDEKI